LTLIHDPKLPHTFNSGRWKRGYNPDRIFVTNSVAQQCSKYIGKPIPNTRHRPMCLQIHGVVRAQRVPFKRRFKYSKAGWTEFTEALENKIQQIEPTLPNYEKFVNTVKETSRKYIPRRCRSQYVTRLDKAKGFLKSTNKNVIETLSLITQYYLDGIRYNR